MYTGFSQTFPYYNSRYLGTSQSRAIFFCIGESLHKKGYPVIFFLYDFSFFFLSFTFGNRGKPACVSDSANQRHDAFPARKTRTPLHGCAEGWAFAVLFTARWRRTCPACCRWSCCRSGPDRSRPGCCNPEPSGRWYCWCSGHPPRGLLFNAFLRNSTFTNIFSINSLRDNKNAGILELFIDGGQCFCNKIRFGPLGRKKEEEGMEQIWAAASCQSFCVHRAFPAHSDYKKAGML